MSDVSIITFATPSFSCSRAALIRSSREFGRYDVSAFDLKGFSKTDFFRAQAAITTQKRGAGYWLWKPYYIHETLKRSKEDDVVIYCDSGVSIAAPLTPLIELVRSLPAGVVLFENYQGSGYFAKSKRLAATDYNLYTELNKNKHWAKRDAFVLMNLDEERYWNAPQVNANFQLYRKCSAVMSFVREWLDSCCDERILTDIPNQCGLPDFDNLFSHIHDQAVLSLLAEKHRIELFRCPSQFGNHYKVEAFRAADEFLLLPYSSQPKSNSAYGTLINHHRLRTMPFLFRLKAFAKQEMNIALSRFGRSIP